MPPPSWIGILSPTAAAIALIALSFFGRPAAAPFRSIRCRRRAPCSSQWRAVAVGIVGKDGRVVHVALLQAHALSIFEVNGRDDQHGGEDCECTCDGNGSDRA